MLKLRILLLSNYFYLILIIFAFLISLIRINLPRTSSYSEKSVYFYGIVTKYNIISDKLTIYLKNKETIIGTYYFTNEKEKEAFKNKISLGDKFIVKAIFYKPIENKTKNTFNYKKYLQNKKIFYTLDIKDIKKVRRNKNLYYKFKNILCKRIDDNPYLNTFLLGNKSYLNKEVIYAYREMGISHLFAISGMHVSILSGILLKILNKKKEKNYLIVSFLLLFYLLMIDISPSAIRGVLFFVLFSLNKVFYFHVSPIKIYLLTLLIIILINPFYIFDVGFLYSFMITFSLIFLSDKLKANNYFKGLIKVSCISFLVSIPITLYNFCQINLLSIIFNLFYVPFISLIVFPLELLNFIFPILNPICNIFINILEQSALYLSKINFLKLTFYKFNILLYFCYFLLIMFFMFEYKKYHKRRVLYVIIVILIIHFLYMDNNTYIKMLDVGQGDSILIYSKREAILVDTGGIQNKEKSIIRNTTLPILKSLGIKKLQKLIITHGDYDHIGEAKYLYEHFKVEDILLNNNKINYYENQLRKYGATKAKEGSTFSCGEITFVQLNKNLKDENDSSLVYLGIYKDKSFLLMGDASIKTEQYLLEKYNLKNITILKVGHHGSKTSSSEKFLEIVKPKISLISAGKDNKFNHPHKEVVKRLKRISNVYVTKKIGTITINLDRKI